MKMGAARALESAASITGGQAKKIIAAEKRKRLREIPQHQKMATESATFVVARQTRLLQYSLRTRKALI
jgi:hypothetical protein